MSKGDNNKLQKITIAIDKMCFSEWKSRFVNIFFWYFIFVENIH